MINKNAKVNGFSVGVDLSVPGNMPFEIVNKNVDFSLKKECQFFLDKNGNIHVILLFSIYTEDDRPGSWTECNTFVDVNFINSAEKIIDDFLDRFSLSKIGEIYFFSNVFFRVDGCLGRVFAEKPMELDLRDHWEDNDIVKQ